MFTLQIIYYNTFSKQITNEKFEEVKVLMERTKDLLNNVNVELLDYHSNENDRYYIAIKMK